MFRRIILRIWYRLIKKSPSSMPMVHYWRSKDYVEAKITKKDGAIQMVLDGEKYPIWGFPRGHLLIPANEKYGPLSVLKHECKQICNRAWEKLEQGVSKEEIIKNVKKELKELPLEPLRYDLMPPQSMSPSVREIYRALTKVGCPDYLRDILTLILQEDDAFRYRLSWLAIWIPWIKWNPVKILDKGFAMVERAEVIGDMKRRIKLLRRTVSLILEDPKIRDMFIRFFREVNWKKVRITEGERYHFRAKYFKVDVDVMDY